MIELIDTLPDIDVQPAEYKRLLGYPRDAVLSGRARELADWARAWYQQHGKPWVYAREAGKLALNNGSIRIDDASFNSSKLKATLEQAGAHSAVLVAVSAGSEVETEAAQLWKDEKPDEYFFLEIYGSAVVEHLTTTTGARLCAWADRQSMAVLPHYSPGYMEWDVGEQPRLLELIRRSSAIPRCLEAMTSGMLRPKKSQLAVFGLTRHLDRVRRLTSLTPCENCSYAPCQYRRAAYVRAPEHSQPETGASEGMPPAQAEAPAAPLTSLDRNAKYLVNANALRRWSNERLSLTPQSDGTTDALFIYDGTTCTSMGRPLRFHYHVKVGPKDKGYPILAQRCVPAPDDEGHKFMCRYMNNAEYLMVAIEQERPLAGKPLNEILAWQRPLSGAGCYCEPADRKHKWGLVLETIHYAMVQREGAPKT